MRKFWIVAAAVALLGFGAAVVFAQGGSSTGDLITTAETGTTQTTTTTERPRRQRDTTTPTTPTPAAPGPGVDISGPCDEAEHANDPRCAGAGGRVEDRDDHRGDDRGNDDDDHRGRGRGHGGDDNGGDDDSGHGGGGDD